MSDLAELVRSRLRDVPDFPSEGVMFKDITPLLGDAEAFAEVVADMATRNLDVDIVAGVEARGFIIGATVAHALGVGFVPLRKAGKLPAETLSVPYDLEYGSATIEVHTDAFTAGQRVLVLDDVLATGGTATAAIELVRLAGAEVEAFETIVELAFLGGRERLAALLPQERIHATLVVDAD